MTNWNMRSRLVALLAPLLAATLACSLLSGPKAKTNTPLTQAAATTTAAASVAATQLAAPTRAPSTTEAPTAAGSPTAAPSATLAPTEASTASPAPATTVAATPQPSAAVVLDPCSLISSDEAQSLIGVPVGKPKTQSGACLIADAATGATSGVVLYALPASQSQTFFDQYTTQLKSSGVQVDPTAADKLKQDTAAGDMVAAVNDLIAMSSGQTKFKARKLDGVGSAALWSWNKSGNAQEGVLLAARPDAIVALILAAGSSAKETDAQPAIQKIVSRVLAGLPASFTVAGLSPASSGPVLDPCSLVTTSDAEALMGTKATGGVSSQGSCDFHDVATKKLLVRVYTLPAGAAAATALEADGGLLLLGNATAEAKVSADAQAGDLVAAVRDMIPANSSVPGRTLVGVDGLGDAAVFFIQTVGSSRLSILLAAKPTAVVGMHLVITPGDDAATKAAAIALLSRVLAQLPPSFTVQ